MRARALLAAASLALFPLGARAAETYGIDAGHSSIGFAVRHMAVSRVRGAFLDYSGSAQVDLDDPTGSSVKVTIDAASIDTRQADRDNHLRSEDFFDVANHPEISFESTSVVREGEELVVVGDLTIRGVTHSVRMPIEMWGPIEDPWGNTRIGISGHLTIDRFDYGLKYNRLLEAGGLVVGREVEVEIDVELVRPGAT